MPKPRYRRRKEERPQEITNAAMEAFAEQGYAATRVDEVARRAGVSKGLMYLYFKTKEELFKAVVRSFVVPKIDALTAEIDNPELGAEEFLRGPFLKFVKQLPGSKISVIIQLMIAEGPKHPDLVQFYWENVASRGIATLNAVVARGVERGEFKPSDKDFLPHMMVMPVLFSVIFKLIFAKQSLDTDALIESQLDLILSELKGGTTP